MSDEFYEDDDFGFEFNPDEVEDTPDYSPLPAGEYHVLISDATIKPTKDGTGKLLRLTLQVVGGQYEGRLVFDNINFINRSAAAVERANRTLKQICVALGIGRVSKPSVFVNKQIKAVVEVANSEKYGKQNNVRRYLPLSPGGSAPPQQRRQSIPPSPWT